MSVVADSTATLNRLETELLRRVTSDRSGTDYGTVPQGETANATVVFRTAARVGVRDVVQICGPMEL